METNLIISCPILKWMVVFDKLVRQADVRLKDTQLVIADDL